MLSAPSTGCDAQVEVLEDAERDQRHDALAVRRDLVQGVAAIVHLERLHPVGLLCAAKSDARIAAVVLPRVGLDFFGDRAAIERLAARCAMLSRTSAWLFQVKRSPGRGARPSRHERFGEPGLVLQLTTCSAHCPAMVGETRNPSRP